ncbi:hypothetical protein FACS1894198_2990 [Clostridia bacterium]|nr:hypothetical protein FACS1894198_2990 [Clostridia bacterium]
MKCKKSLALFFCGVMAITGTICAPVAVAVSREALEKTAKLKAAEQEANLVLDQLANFLNAFFAGWKHEPPDSRIKELVSLLETSHLHVRQALSLCQLGAHGNVDDFIMFA